MMFEPLHGVLSADGFVPHGQSFLWHAGILWSDAAADALIALSLCSIPVALGTVLLRRRDLPYRGSVMLLGIALLCIGMTHALGAIDLWVPSYWLDAAMRCLAALLALIAAISLWLQMPGILSLPDRAELIVNNQTLKKEIETRIRLEREMHELNHTLEYRVHQRTAQLERLNHELRQESGDRKRAEEQTRSLNLNLEHRVAERTAQLRLANQELEAFSYSVAHDLWAPLRAIDGFSQALLEDYSAQLPEAGKRFLSRIRAGTQRMGVLIDSMLELSRLTRSDMLRQAVDLSRMAHEVFEDLAANEKRSDITLVVQEGQSTYGDPKYIRVVMENLLGNSWKYTSKTPLARIEFGRWPQGSAEQPVWFVRDNGAGFDMTQADKLFGVFQRLHTESEFPGTGVGLATVRRILAKHDGRIWAADAHPGKGATFCFTIGSIGAAPGPTPPQGQPNGGG